MYFVDYTRNHCSVWSWSKLVDQSFRKLYFRDRAVALTPIVAGNPASVSGVRHIMPFCVTVDDQRTPCSR